MRVVGSNVLNSRSPHPDLAAGDLVEQRRLAGVRVAGQRHGRQVRALALGPLDGAVGAHVVEPAAQRGDAVARQPAIGLDLGLARASRADAADAAAGAETLEMRPQAAHARHVVLELGELDLELALGRVGVAGEDVEDHGRAVEHRQVERRLEVALLARGQLVVGDDEVGVRRLQQRLELLDLARPEVEVGMRLVADLHHVADGGDAGGPQQLAQLGQLVGLRRGGEHEGTLPCPSGALRRCVAGLGLAAVAGLLHDDPV